MSNFATNEIERMKELMGLNTLNESAPVNSNKPVIEFTQLGADGKNYAIARVCDKHYIMEAPMKNTEILAEDYDYVGGFENRKAYNSYNVASKQFELKMKCINEAYSKDMPMLFETVQQADWQINETKEMRNAINRINQISNNVDIILEGDVRKGVGFGPVGDKAPYDEKAGKFTEELAPEKANASRDTDWTNDDESVSKKIEKTNDEIGSSHASDAAGKHTTGYTEKAPKGKDLKESRTIKLTEEQVLAWNRNSDDYMDKSHGTEIGDTAPYSEKAKCPICGGSDSKAACKDGVVCEGEDWGSEGVPAYPKASVGNVGHNGDPFEDELKSETNLDESMFEIELDNEGEDELADSDYSLDGGIPAGFEASQFEDETFGDENVSGPMPSEDILGDEEDEYLPEDGEAEFELDLGDTADADPEMALENLIRESVLNDFGKHPAYRKEPFTLPGNNEPAKKEWAHRWDSETNLNDEEFGKQIGHNGDPFTEKVIDMLTNTIMVELGQKKK